MNQFIEIGLDDVAKDLSKKTTSSFNENKTEVANTDS